MTRLAHRLGMATLSTILAGPAVADPFEAVTGLEVAACRRDAKACPTLGLTGLSHPSQEDFQSDLARTPADRTPVAVRAEWLCLDKTHGAWTASLCLAPENEADIANAAALARNIGLPVTDPDAAR